MPIPPENLAMVGSDWPGADWNREKSTRLVGPRRGGELRAHTPGRLAKFHAPEIAFGPGCAGPHQGHHHQPDAGAEISVIEPRMLTTMPDWLNASTGRDALTHGIEALFRAAL